MKKSLILSALFVFANMQIAAASNLEQTALSECQKMAQSEIASVINLEQADEDQNFVSYAIVKNEVLESVVEDNGLFLEGTIKVTTYSLDDEGQEKNESYSFDVLYDFAKKSCDLGEEPVFDRQWCSGNCIK